MFLSCISCRVAIRKRCLNSGQIDVISMEFFASNRTWREAAVFGYILLYRSVCFWSSSLSHSLNVSRYISHEASFWSSRRREASSLSLMSRQRRAGAVSKSRSGLLFPQSAERIEFLIFMHLVTSHAKERISTENLKKLERDMRWIDVRDTFIQMSNQSRKCDISHFRVLLSLFWEITFVLEEEKHHTNTKCIVLLKYDWSMQGSEKRPHFYIMPKSRNRHRYMFVITVCLDKWSVSLRLQFA